VDSFSRLVRKGTRRGERRRVAPLYRSGAARGYIEGKQRSLAMTRFLFITAGTAATFYLALFSIVSWKEKERRAAWTAALCAVAFACFWLGGYLVFHPADAVIAGATLLAILCILLFFLPLGKKPAPERHNVTAPVDERDTMFARADLEPGNEKYDSYYGMRPENRTADDGIRRLPRLLCPGGRLYDPFRSPYVAAMFAVEERNVRNVDGPVNPGRCGVNPAVISRLLKGLVLHLGAQDAGIARVNPMYWYSHVGRGPEPWGSEIRNPQEFAVVFAVEMSYRKVAEAPAVGITEETALQYLNAQRISITLAEYIRRLGYPARAHISGSNYQVMLPPLAVDAGLGEIGRMGYLISPKYGARIRLGAVTTDIPLIPDGPIAFGVKEFCESCLKCAANCPPKAIPSGPRTRVRGVEKWPLKVESCYRYWRVLGSDCGLCMRVCPFSHPDTMVHNLLRAGIRRSAFARLVSRHGDDWFYGRRIFRESRHGQER
jgi:ferredoxin